jgi:hydrogenase expression/formation protein HypD
VVIAGFEPLDVMQAILMLVRQVNEGRAEVENEFTRAVTEDGNLKAQALVAEVFELRESFEWRGLGCCPLGAAHPRALRRLRRRGALRPRLWPVPDHKACECGPSCAGSRRPSTASCSAPCARPKRRWARAWCRPKRLRRPLHLWALPRHAGGR